MRTILHIPGNVDVTIKLIMINVNGDSKYSTTGFMNDTGILGTVIAECFNTFAYFYWSNESKFKAI